MIKILVLLLVFLFITLTPSCNTVLIHNLYDGTRIYEVAIIVLCLLSLCISHFFRSKTTQLFFLFSLKVRLLLLSVLVLAVLSSLSAPLIRSAFLEVSLYACLFLLALAIGAIALDNLAAFQIGFLSTVLVSSVFYQTTFFVAYLASFIENIPLEPLELFGGFSNIRFFNLYQSWLFFLTPLPVLLYPDIGKPLQKAVIIVAINWVVLLWASAGRGESIALISGLIISRVLFKQQASAFTKLMWKVFLFGTLAFIILFQVIPAFFYQHTMEVRSVESLATVSDRIALWQIALSHIKNNPGLGIGAMHYAYYPAPLPSVHNAFLQWGAEMGIPSLFALIYLIKSGLLAWKNYFNSLGNNQQTNFADRQLAIALCCTVISELIHSMVTSILISPMGQILLAAIVGWMFALHFRSHTLSLKTADRNLSSLILIGGLLITLTYTIMPELAPRLVGLEDFSSRYHSEMMHPRFWQQGEIPD